jgi:hypothetical protein
MDEHLGTCSAVSRRLVDAIGMTRKKGGIRTRRGYCMMPGEPVSPMDIIGAISGARGSSGDKLIPRYEDSTMWRSACYLG